MVLCKFFQQGNCRYGNYCKFEHNYGNRTKNYSDDKNIVLLVAEETLQSERGGQWLLSCFGPFKEKKCIPGMEDVSPDEVRWEMYQAQKNNTVDVVNAQFQRMCEEMKLKKAALKNPTPQLFQLLEEIQNTVPENYSNKGNYAFGQSQMGSNSNQTTNVFAQSSNSPFTTSNAFGNRSTVNNTVFGGKSSFGSNNTIFGSSSNTNSNTNSIFGGGNKQITVPFGGVQNTQTFGNVAAPQGTSSIFGGATVTAGQSIFGGTTAGSSATFGQPGAFSATTAQPGNSLFKPQVGQTSIFGGTSTNTNVFANPATVQNPASNSVFGVTPVVSNATSGIFSQPATSTSAFGSAPVFGGAPAFGATSGSNNCGQVFGNQAFTSGTFNNTGATSFGTVAAQNLNIFAGANNNLNSGVNNTFSETVPNATPFGQQQSATVAAFSSGQQVQSNTAAATPFGQQSIPTAVATAPFGTAGFATTTTNTGNVFGATVGPFGGNVQPSSTIFGTAAVATVATNTTNVFMSKPQQDSASPFGVASSTQANPFGNFAVSSTTSVVITIIDEKAYSKDGDLTDDDINAFKSLHFDVGKIPLKPPTKALA